jgi:hypothetical protein
MHGQSFFSIDNFPYDAAYADWKLKTRLDDHHKNHAAFSCVNWSMCGLAGLKLSNDVFYFVFYLAGLRYRCRLDIECSLLL